MKIDHTQLSTNTLDNLIEAYVLREGTDYGWVEKTLLEKREAVLQQLKTGDAVILYDEETQTCNILPTHLHF